MYIYCVFYHLPASVYMFSVQITGVLVCLEVNVVVLAISLYLQYPYILLLIFFQ